MWYFLIVGCAHVTKFCVSAEYVYVNTQQTICHDVRVVTWRSNKLNAVEIVIV
jgi:hypothetical protein